MEMILEVLCIYAYMLLQTVPFPPTLSLSEASLSLSSGEVGGHSSRTTLSIFLFNFFLKQSSEAR